MLIQFVVENVLSFKEQTIFSMLASKEESHPTHRIKPKGSCHTLVRGAALYGANASGKSNLVKAMAFAQEFIVEGVKPNENIPLDTFRLGTSSDTGSYFQFDFVHEGIEFSYGFRLCATHVMAEFLYGNPNGREATYFERASEPKEGGGFNNEVTLGAMVKKGNSEFNNYLKYKVEEMPGNQLFLRAVAESNYAHAIEGLRLAMEWFRKVLITIEPDVVNPHIETELYYNEPFRHFTSQLLQRADTGLASVDVEEKPLDISGLIGIPEKIKKKMLEDLAKRPSDSESPKGIVLGSSFGRISIAKNKNNESVLLNLRLQHTGVSGELISFDVENESDGTLKMLHLAYALFQIRQGKNRIYVIDELDRCLHTRLSSLFLYMALQQEAENQVIVTTHDTNLINRELLRKDEIWVVDKDAFGASHLTSLAEFKTHADMPLEKAYMQGRFGGVPHIQDMDDLGLHIKGLEPTHVS